MSSRVDSTTGAFKPALLKKNSLRQMESLSSSSGSSVSSGLGNSHDSLQTTASQRRAAGLDSFSSNNSPHLRASMTLEEQDLSGSGSHSPRQEVESTSRPRSASPHYPPASPSFTSVSASVSPMGSSPWQEMSHPSTPLPADENKQGQNLLLTAVTSLLKASDNAQEGLQNRRINKLTRRVQQSAQALDDSRKKIT